VERRTSCVQSQAGRLAPHAAGAAAPGGRRPPGGRVRTADDGRTCASSPDQTRKRRPRPPPPRAAAAAAAAAAADAASPRRPPARLEYLKKPRLPLQAKLLEETKLDDIRGLQTITVLKDNATVEQALKARGARAGRACASRVRVVLHVHARASVLVRGDRRHRGGPVPPGVGSGVRFSRGPAAACAERGARSVAQQSAYAHAHTVTHAHTHTRTHAHTHNHTHTHKTNTAQMLAAKRVLSAPVKLAGAPPPDGTGVTIFGFVDVRDIVSSFFQLGGRLPGGFPPGGSRCGCEALAAAGLAHGFDAHRNKHTRPPRPLPVAKTSKPNPQSSRAWTSRA
jgi:hypothetical protein